MADYVVMPKLGFDMREGVLNQWTKSIGDPVARGEVIAEIESDKATLELESQLEGVLLHVLQEAGAIVPVGANLAIVGEEGEDISALLSGEAVAEAGEAPSEPYCRRPGTNPQDAVQPIQDEGVGSGNLLTPNHE